MTDTNTNPIDNIDNTPQPEQPEVKNPAAVLAKNKELLTKNAELAARIAELEGQLTEAATNHEKLSNDFADFHIKRPLARLAEEISELPDVWMTEFSKSYDVKPVENDDLGIFTKDGKRCTIPEGRTNGGEPVKFTAQAVWWMLCDFSPESEAKRWRAMTNYMGPRGSGAPGSSGGFGRLAPTAPQKPQAQKPAFGIR